MYAFRLLRRHYMDAILVVLDRLGGRAPVSQVQDGVQRELNRFMTEVDLSAVPSNAREVRWRNDTRWARIQLVDEGLLHAVHEAGRGMWSLTPRGRAAVPEAETRLRSPPAHTRRLSDDARAIRAPIDSSRQLTFLAEVFRRAHETPVGEHSHPALHDVMATLERLLHAKLVAPPVVHPPPPPRSASPRDGSSVWAPPVPTATATPNHMDEKRMVAFIDGPWRQAVLEMKRSSTPEKAARARELDLLAALPAVTCLVAARSGWLSLAQGAHLASRSVHRIMMDGLGTGGLVGALPLRDNAELCATMREGLFHRTLTGWVQHLDRAADDMLTLWAAPLRTWLNELRAVLGDPTDVGPRRADPMWEWLFEQDPTYEPPRDGSVEDDARALAVWLASLPRGEQPPPGRGALLWHPRAGWAVAAGDSRDRFDPHFSARLLVSSETLRLKFFSKTGWVDVDRATISDRCPEAMREAARRVGELARRSSEGTPR